MTLRHRIGSHPFISIVLISAAIAGAVQGYIAIFNQPRCNAIWAETRMRVEATLTECLRSTVPLRTKIPTDAQLETTTAELDGAPKPKGKAK